MSFNDLVEDVEETNPEMIEVPMEIKGVLVTHVKDLRDDLTCSICKDYFCEPITLICNHTYCRLCLIRANENNNHCPLCNTRFWIPDYNITNNILKSMIVKIIGEEGYKERMEELEKHAIRETLEEEVREEIRRESWRNILDTLPPDARRRHQPLGLSGPSGMGMMSISGVPEPMLISPRRPSLYTRVRNYLNRNGGVVSLGVVGIFIGLQFYRVFRKGSPVEVVILNK